MGDSGTREARPKGAPLALPSAAHLSLILIGERETTGDESGLAVLRSRTLF